MSIQSQRINSFLRVNQTSLKEHIEQALTESGLNFEMKKFHVRGAKASGHEGVKTFAEYSLPDLTMIGPFGETMNAVLRFRDSQVPGQALTVSLGVFRLVCLNGLFGMSHQTVQRIIHRAGPTNEGRLSGLVDAVKAAAGSLHTVGDFADDLADTPIADPIAAVAMLNIPNRTKEAVIQAIANERYRPVDNPRTAWGLYNLVNEFDRLASRGMLASSNRDEKLADDIMAIASAEVTGD
jgi:hypothetical protein